jgi:hypothetical protein
VNNINNTSQPLLKKLDLRVAILGLTREIKRTKKANESYELNQQRALKLLKKDYKGKLKVSAFLKAIALFKDKGNTVSFLTLTDKEYQDLWLKIKCNTRLK